MTAQLLATDLGSLIQDSKRKNAELRSAAEKSLQDLKSLSVTSEAQLSADLARRPHFISPFLLACSTQNVKYASTGVTSLRRLGVAKALPKESLKDVFEAFGSCVNLNHEIQLKILQALPSLVQNYPGETQGPVIASALQICSAFNSNKNFAVSNTAAATLQQLVIAIYDRVILEDDNALQIPSRTEVPGNDGPIAVRPAAFDAYRIFNDLNLMLVGEKPDFVHFHALAPTTTLEVLELILSNYAKIMATHAEQIHMIRSSLMPAVIRMLSERLTFPATLRIMRIVDLLIRHHLDAMPPECEIALGLLNHILEPGVSSTWKRALCLEIFKDFYSDPRLLFRMYAHFDEVEGRTNVLGDNLSSFVRLASEKPALIGLGQHSSIPSANAQGKSASSEQAVAEAGALAGVIGGPVTESGLERQTTGIGHPWSSLKTPCLEQLDKFEPPQLPETYLYGLILTCITNLSESLARFILPLTVPQDGKRNRRRVEQGTTSDASNSADGPEGTLQRSRTQSFRRKTVPVNPLSLKDHSAHSYIQTSATLVAGCWPAILASCSTFLNATLDTDYYRALVRAIQKIAQVAGLLRLFTPRDAFLTTLGKAAVPSTLLLSHAPTPKSPPTEQSRIFSNAKGLLSVDSLVSQATTALDRGRRPSHEHNLPGLGARNLLCLRALLNLAIALGPTLHSAWSIILETLQLADRIIAGSNQFGARPTEEQDMVGDGGAPLEKVEAEAAAVQAAARRLFESTADFPCDAFVEVLQALCALIHEDRNVQSGDRTPTNDVRSQTRPHRRAESTAGLTISTDSSVRDAAFALNKIGELVSLNVERFSTSDPMESGWTLLVSHLIRLSADDRNGSSSRLLSADILSQTIRDVAELATSANERDLIQARVLSALRDQMTSIQGRKKNRMDTCDEVDVQIHYTSLETLRAVIEQCGETLGTDWASAFESLMSVFVQPDLDGIVATLHEPLEAIHVVSKTLSRSAFGTTQLICSDFLGVVPNASLAMLLELLLRFARQQEDLNMSLIATTCFWNISDFLRPRSDLLELPDLIGPTQSNEDLNRTIRMKAHDGTTAALWLQVPCDLSALTVDNRAGVRNSAIQTIQRIFENYVDHLSAKAWILCLRSVLFGMVENNVAAQARLRATNHVLEPDHIAWDETTGTALETVSDLLVLYMDKAVSDATLDHTWSNMLDCLEKYFEHGSHRLATSVFTTIAKVLSSLKDPEAMGTAPLAKTAQVWQKYYGQHDLWQRTSAGNQEAFVAYAKAFQAIYRLAYGVLENKDLMNMLDQLKACVKLSDPMQYSSDVDNMTTFQMLAMDCFAMTRTDGSELSVFMMRTLSELAALPNSVAQDASKVPTFVALSKAAMSLLQKVITQHVTEPSIYSSGAFLDALVTLVRPVQGKYKGQKEGKPPALWQCATTAILEILSASVSHLTKTDGPLSTKIWEQVVAIATAITSASIADFSLHLTLEADESFDVNSLRQLLALTTDPLGSPALPDSLRRTYTRNLFVTSILFQPIPGEIPDLINVPLEDLYTIRLGRTDSPAASPRPRMSYTALSELFSLVRLRASTPAQVKLAQAAAPYLILRAALTLRMYIADHPLRGTGGMPQPFQQRKELLFILVELGRLECEPSGIPDAEGSTGGSKHLHRLFPLLVKVLRASRRDEEVFESVVQLVERVGGEFGVNDGDEE